MGFVERVEILVKARNLASGVFKSVNTNIQATKKILSATNMEFASMHTRAGMINRRVRSMQSVMGRMAAKVRKATAAFRGFRMEMLGVMFFGMNLQRFFTGLLRPSLEMVGVFDLWASTLQIFFLPFAIQLLEFVLKLSDYLLGLDEDTKKTITKFVLWGAVLGVLLFLVGTFALGIGAIIIAFGSLLNIVDRLTPDIEVLGVNLSSIVEAFIGFKIVQGIFKSIVFVFKQVMGFLGGFEQLDSVIGDIDGTSRTWLDGFKEKLDELGVTKLKKDLEETLPIFGKLADALTSIASILFIWEQRIANVLKGFRALAAAKQLLGITSLGTGFNVKGGSQIPSFKPLTTLTGSSGGSAPQNVTFNTDINVTGGLSNRTEIEGVLTEFEQRIADKIRTAGTTST